MSIHINLTFHFHHNNFSFLQHDFQHGSSKIEFDSSLLCVENHVLRLKIHCETNKLLQLLGNILDAANNYVHIRN